MLEKLCVMAQQIKCVKKLHYGGFYESNGEFYFGVTQHDFSLLAQKVNVPKEYTGRELEYLELLYYDYENSMHISEEREVDCWLQQCMNTSLKLTK